MGVMLSHSHYVSCNASYSIVHACSVQRGQIHFMFGISLELYLVLNVFASLCSCLSDSYVRIESAFDTSGLIVLPISAFQCLFFSLAALCLRSPPAKGKGFSMFRLSASRYHLGFWLQHLQCARCLAVSHGNNWLQHRLIARCLACVSMEQALHICLHTLLCCLLCHL